MSLVSYRLVWPRRLTDEQILAALRGLAGSAGTPVVLDNLGSGGRVEHRLRVSEGRSAALITQLRGTSPGVGMERVEAPAPIPFSLAIELRLSTCRRALRSDIAELTSQAVLHALAQAARGETVLLRWLLTDRLAPQAVPSAIASLPAESWPTALLRAPFKAPGPADADTRSGLRDKQREPGWRVIGRLAVQAASASRRRQLASGVIGALRQAEGPGVQITGRTTRTATIDRLGGHGRNRLNVREFAGICGWPIGDTSQLPVIRLGSRRLPVPAAIPAHGRVIGEGTWPGRARPLALSPDDGLRHLHVLGPTGTGKSTLLLNLIGQDIAAGRGVLVVDPKSDLISDVLARVPEERLGDVVVIDPTSTDRPVGLNPLAPNPGLSPEVTADQLLAVFHGLYAANWGPRTSDILGAALLTLAQTVTHGLVAIPLLLTNAAFRRRLVGQLHDPVGLGPFWAQFEAWSEAERTTAIAPVLNKLRPFLVRRNLRRMVGQPSPRFRLADVFSKRRIVLVDLAKGRIGSEAAQLLGALVLTQFWQAAQARSSVPSAQRHPVAAYLDEFQDYLALPISLEDALAQARGLGLSFVLAHQHLKQLPPSLKSAVLANARSRIAFQLGHEDARELARDQLLLGAEDFAGLDRYHFYAQLVADGQVQPWTSGRTYPPEPGRIDATAVRKIAAERYGTASDDIDEQLAQLLGVAPAVSTGDDLQPRRRGGTS